MGLVRYTFVATVVLMMAAVSAASAGSVALTFDDGPDPEWTPRLLDILRREKVVATFCLVGQRVAEHPDIARRIQAEGHELCNHSWSHPKLTRENVDRQIARTDASVSAATGTVPRILRAPGGNIQNVGDCYGARPFVGWGRWTGKVFDFVEDTNDWKYRSVSHTTNVAVNARPGSIVLMHDIHESTIKAVPGIIAGLKSRGVNFVRASVLSGDACGDGNARRK